MARILMVDDDEELVELVTEYLRREGFEIEAVHNGETGLQRALSSSPDLVVLDVMLPGIGGFEVLRRIRASDPQTARVPILMLTARGEEIDRVMGLEWGADDYLAKPHSPQELLSRVRAMLRRGASPRPAVLAVGDLTLDPAARTAARGDAAIELTAREFSLLELLMRRQGQVVSKVEIIDHVWETPGASDLNVVEVYVGYLRRKVDAPFGRRSIVTVRGSGYRLVADDG